MAQFYPDCKNALIASLKRIDSAYRQGILGSEDIRANLIAEKEKERLNLEVKFQKLSTDFASASRKLSDFLFSTDNISSLQTCTCLPSTSNVKSSKADLKIISCNNMDAISIGSCFGSGHYHRGCIARKRVTKKWICFACATHETLSKEKQVLNNALKEAEADYSVASEEVRALILMGTQLCRNEVETIQRVMNSFSIFCKKILPGNQIILRTPILYLARFIKTSKISFNCQARRNNSVINLQRKTLLQKQCKSFLNG
jgi:hypothetical protein